MIIPGSHVAFILIAENEGIYPSSEIQSTLKWDERYLISIVVFSISKIFYFCIRKWPASLYGANSKYFH